jgi:replication factor A1
MLNIPYDVVVKKIIEEKGLSQAEIEDKIEKKMAQLAGLVSKDGAAHIIANELGVKVMEQKGSVKIKEIFAGMRGLETQGKVTRKLELYEFQRGETTGKVASFFIGDETGQIRITLWHDQTKEFDNIKEGDIIIVRDASAKKNNNFVEVHLDSRSQLIINPSNVKIDEVKQFTRERKTIKELTEEDSNVELLGTIVQVFDIRFFEVCSICNKKLQQTEDGLACQEHGKEKLDHNYVLNVFLDDGSSTIRVVFFKNQLQNLLKKTHEEILGYRVNTEVFEQVKNELLGEMIKVIGRAKKNQMFDRLEFTSNLVFTDIDPEEEIKKMADSKQ